MSMSTPTLLNTLYINLSSQYFSYYVVDADKYDEEKSFKKLKGLLTKAFSNQYNEVVVQFLKYGYPQDIHLEDDNCQRKQLSDYHYFEFDYFLVQRICHKDDWWVLKAEEPVQIDKETLYTNRWQSPVSTLNLGDTVVYASYEGDKARPYPTNEHKDHLPIGPWSFEPDRLEFIWQGLPCLVLRRPKGYFCGYVGIPFSHKLASLTVEEIYKYSKDRVFTLPVEISYASTEGIDIKHYFSPMTKIRPQYYWIGFCCNYIDDLIPAEQGTEEDIFENQTYKDINYVFEKCRKLAELFFQEA